MVHSPPREHGLNRSRWWLAGIGQVVPWLTECSLPGIWSILRRWAVVYKRGRRYVHSPDPDYAKKLKRLRRLIRAVRAQTKRWVLVYQDELTYYRRPTVAQGYAQRGSDTPYARQGLGTNSKRRIAASLDLLTGQVFAWQRSCFDRDTLIRYYRALQAAYPTADRIFVVQDNWPVHFHPDVLAALRTTRITLVPLPTYAPWTNPIEKLWRKLAQEVLHLHEFADHWDKLQRAVTQWLDQFQAASPDLLRYVGLPVPVISELNC